MRADTALVAQTLPDFAREAEMGDAVAVQMADLPAVDGEPVLAALADPGRDPWPCA